MAPAGRGAAVIAELFWWMFGGGVAVWLAVIALTVFALRSSRPTESRWGMGIIVTGALLPTVVLAALLVYGLQVLEDLVEPAPEGALTVEVTGEQWWWRVRYPGEVELANELHLPVGEPVRLRLASADVVHSFWVPALGGKMDMIPGRVTELVLHPTELGVYRGVCAEYCGESHARMAFRVVVESRVEFEKWLARQELPARERAAEGAAVFLRSGCPACHTVRGTRAGGRIGPDLTHVASRRTLAAGTLPNELESLLAWLEDPAARKPGVHMPSFSMLAAEDRRALARWLAELR